MENTNQIIQPIAPVILTPLQRAKQKYYFKNKATISANYKIYYQENKEHLTAKRKQTYHANKNAL
jgi:hypothetical protein